MSCQQLMASQALEEPLCILIQDLAAEGSVVLLGECLQLPNTALTQVAKSVGLSQSLFDRLDKVCSYRQHSCSINSLD
jgi:hypothetical protein